MNLLARTFAHRWIRNVSWTLVGIVATATVSADSCSGTVDNSTLPVGYSIEVTNTVPIVVTPGVPVTINVKLTRLNGFTGAVVVSGKQSASNLTFDASTTIAPSATTAALTFTVPVGTPQANKSLGVEAAADGYGVAYVSFNIAIAPPGSFTVSAPATTNVVLGLTAHIPVTLVRNQYTSSVALTISGLSAGLTASVTSPGTGSTGDILVTSDGAFAAAPYHLTVTATGTDGQVYTAAADVFTHVPRFTLTADNPVTIPSGGSAAATITANRDPGYSASIPLSASPAIPAITFAATSIVYGSTPIQIVVPAGTSAGTYQVQVNGSAGTQYFASVNQTVIVTAAPINTTYSFCSASGLPVFFAVQDGASTAAWRAVTGSGGVYPFTIVSANGGIAYVTTQSGVTTLHVFYGSQPELATQGASLCARGTGGTSSTTGTIANAGSATQVDVAIGSALTFVQLGSTTNFSLQNIEPAPVDLVATALSGSAPKMPSKMIVRRGLNPAITALAPLDFNGTDAFTPASASLSIAGGGGFINVIYKLHTNHNDQSTYYSDGATASTFNFFGIPATLLQATDLHYVTAVNNSGSGSTTALRTGAVMVTTVAGQTITLGSALNAPVVTAPISSTTAHPQAVLTVQAEYNKLFEADFQQSTGSNHNAIIQMTAAYAGGAPSVTLAVPSTLIFSVGWNDSYGLLNGFLTHWIVTGTNWTGPGITMPAWMAGNTLNSATQQGDITTP